MSLLHAWRVLVLKIAALLSFCGGPMVVFDLVKSPWGTAAAFGVAMAPPAAMIFGVYSFWEENPSVWDRTMVCGGLVGAAALVAMNVIGILYLVPTNDREDTGLIQVGTLIGIVFVAHYVWRARKFLGRVGDAI